MSEALIPAQGPVDVNVMPHTPGPWRVAPRCNCMIDVLHENNAKGAITKALCRVQARDSWIDEAEANARLIAAAPDLLAALNCLLHATMYRDHPAESDMAVAAISKATLGHNVKVKRGPATEGETK